MTRNSQDEDGVTFSQWRSGSWTVQVPLIISVVVAFWTGCQSGGGDHYRPDEGNRLEKPDNQQLLQVVSRQLDEAKIAKEWGSADQTAFEQNLVGLSFKARLKLSSQLATLINNKTLKLKPDPRPQDPPICPCVPGLCGETQPPAPAPAPIRGAK
jgi:hypothetical protein